MAVYLMPNGNVASVDLGDGRVSLVSREKFEECCCPPQCQWESVFYWDCAEEKWERSVDKWVDKIEPPDTVIEQGDCVRLVYGDSGDCELGEGERPDVPPDFEGDPPEEPEHCCAECGASGLLDQYVFTAYSVDSTSFGDPGTCAEPFFKQQWRHKEDIILDRTSPTSTTWEGWGLVKKRVDNMSGGGFGNFENVSVLVRAVCDGGHTPKRWQLSVILGFFGGFKYTGDSPAGNYGWQINCVGFTPPTTSRGSATVS